MGMVGQRRAAFVKLSRVVDSFFTRQILEDFRLCFFTVSFIGRLDLRIREAGSYRWCFLRIVFVFCLVIALTVWNFFCDVFDVLIFQCISFFDVFGFSFYFFFLRFCQVRSQFGGQLYFFVWDKWFRSFKGSLSICIFLLFFSVFVVLYICSYWGLLFYQFFLQF